MSKGGELSCCLAGSYKLRVIMSERCLCMIDAKVLGTSVLQLLALVRRYMCLHVHECQLHALLS